MYAKGLRSTSIAMDGGVSRKGKLIENNSSVWNAPLRSLSPSHLIYSNFCCSFFNTCLTLLNFLKYCICRHFLCRPRFCCCCCGFNLSLWLPRWWWRWLLVVVVCSACFVLLLIPFSLHFFSPIFFCLFERRGGAWNWTPLSLPLCCFGGPLGWGRVLRKICVYRSREISSHLYILRCSAARVVGRKKGRRVGIFHLFAAKREISYVYLYSSNDVPRVCMPIYLLTFSSLVVLVTRRHPCFDKREREVWGRGSSSWAKEAGNEIRSERYGEGWSTRPGRKRRKKKTAV